jgi:Predicted permeases
MKKILKGKDCVIFFDFDNTITNYDILDEIIARFSPGKEWVDLHYKIAFPMISLIIILVGAPFAMITTRGGVLIGIGMSIAIGLLYYASIAIFIAFGKAGILPPIASAWLGNVIFAALGIYLVNKRT